MEMPSGSPPSGETGSSPEHPTPAYTSGATNNAQPSAHATPHVGAAEAGDTPAGESLDETPDMSGAGEAASTHVGHPPPTENAANAMTGQPQPQSPQSLPQGDAFVISENRRPVPPPPLRYGEPRPAITANRVGEPIRAPEPIIPPAPSRPLSDSNAMPPVYSPNPPEPQPEPRAQGENEGAVYPPAGTDPVGTPLSPQPAFQSPRAAPPPQAPNAPPMPPQPPSYPYSYPPQPAQPAPAASGYTAPPLQPRPYGSAPSYAPPTSAPYGPPAAPAGYMPATALATAAPATQPAGLNNRLLTIIAILLAASMLLQLFNALRPVRFDGAQPVQVQARPLSSTTQSKVKDTLDNAQKAINDINTQSQQDYNAATTDAQRQAILAKYSFSLQQIIAQEQNDMLRIMQEQTTP